MNPEIIRLTREQLYELVWSEPMRNLAQRFGISDVGLAKNCRRMKIPLPGRGHWARKAAGQKVGKPPLPTLPPTDTATPRNTAFQPVPMVLHPIPTHGPAAALLAFEAQPESEVKVPTKLTSPHPLVAETLAALTSKPAQENAPEIHQRARRLDIEVSNGLLRRALRIADALVKAFEHRGWPVSLGTGEDRKTYVSILDQKIAFGVRETIKKIPTEPEPPRRLSNGQLYTPYQPKYRDRPSGRLSLIARHSWGHSVDKSWIETETRPLEARLNDFIVAVVLQAAEQYDRHMRHLDELRAKQEAEELRLAEQRCREVAAAKVARLEEQVQRWSRSQQRVEFATAVRTLLAQSADERPSGTLIDWLAWVDEYAKSLNPLCGNLADLPFAESASPREFLPNVEPHLSRRTASSRANHDVHVSAEPSERSDKAL